MKRASDSVIDFAQHRGLRGAVTLDDLAGLPIWLAWRAEDGTKIPYCAAGGSRGASTAPETWRTRAECERWAAKQLKYNKVAGIGVVLGADIGDGRVIIGVDLDSCRSPDGVLADWAQDVVERFGSYGEVSPSRSGVKLFGVLGKTDLPLVIAMLGGSLGRSWKRAVNGAAKAAGLEFYAGGRYFCVTGEPLPNSPAEMRPIDIAKVRWLITEAGPAFVGNGKSKTGRTDWSRSGDALAFAGRLHRSKLIKSYDEMVAALTASADPAIRDWAVAKGMERRGGVDQYELKRVWDKLSTDFERGAQGQLRPNSQANIIRAVDRLGVTLAFDLFAERMLIGGPDGTAGRYLDDHEMRALRLRIDAEFGFLAEKELFFDVVLNEARKHAFHPVCDYLDGVRWDGVPRLENWLVTYAGAEDSDYTRAVGRLILVAACRRVRRPGAKFDEMVVLETPPQGMDKSSALAILAVRPEWFSDSLSLGAKDREVIEQLRGRWIVECSDLQGMRKGDVDHLKSLLSRQFDRAREVYNRLLTEAGRQCVFFGTTNSDRYLRDTTGNRRYWPVRIERFDTVALERDRDQLWAEAAAAEANGESIRLDPGLYGVAAVEQDKRRTIDPWVDVIRGALGDYYGKLSTKSIWTIVDVPVDRRTYEHNTRLGDAMRLLGWQHKKLRIGAKPDWCYWRPDPNGSDPTGRFLPTIYVDRDGEGWRVSIDRRDDDGSLN